ncbi:tyrosinase [Streptomyces badius]
MYTRKNQRDLTRTEKRLCIDAILKPKRSGRYDDFVVMHREYYVMDTERLRAAHMTSSFFPWHRQYLLEFEKALQRVDAGVSVPYWDWTQDNRPTSSLWAEDFLGGNGRPGDRRYVLTGPVRLRGGQLERRQGRHRRALPHPQLRQAGQRPGIPAHQERPGAGPEDPVYDTAPWNSVSTEGFRNRVEGWGIRGVRTGRPAQPGAPVGRSTRSGGRGLPRGPGVLAPPLFHRPALGPRKAVQVRLPAGPRNRPRPQDRDYVFGLDEAMPPWGVTPKMLLDHSKIYRYA